MYDLSHQEKKSIVLPVMCNMDESDETLEGYTLLGRVLHGSRDSQDVGRARPMGKLRALPEGGIIWTIQ